MQHDLVDTLSHRHSFRVPLLFCFSFGTGVLFEGELTPLSDRRPEDNNGYSSDDTRS